MHQVIFSLIFLGIQLLQWRKQLCTLCAGVAKSFWQTRHCLEHGQKICGGVAKLLGHMRQCPEHLGIIYADVAKYVWQMLRYPEHVDSILVHFHPVVCGFAKYRAHLPSFLGHLTKSVGGLTNILGHVPKSFGQANASVAPSPNAVVDVLRALVEGSTIPAFVLLTLVEVCVTSSVLLAVFRHLLAISCQVPTIVCQMLPAFATMPAAFYDLYPLAVVAPRPP